MANYGVYVLILVSLMSEKRCLAATNFCQQPLGMERRIITDSQISESSAYQNRDSYKGYQARLNNNRCWCSATATQTNQYVKVDFGRLLGVTGIAIQGDPNHPPNYITKFKLTFTTDGSKYLYKIDSTNTQKELIGASGQNQLVQRWFLTKPFPARIMEFKPTEKAAGGNDICARFELYGCAYVCGGGLGIESGLSLPSGFTLSASSSKAGFEASNGRLSGSSSWCASTNNVNSEYLQIDFGRIITMTGIAIQGNPNADSWVKEFYLDYGTSTSTLSTYQEGGTSKVFVGNNDRSTMVVNWFLVRLTARYVRVKPNTVNGDICMRIEIAGCDSEFVGEIGAENRVLEDNRFHAFAWSNWFSDGRYAPKDGRLNNDRPWGRTSTDTSFMWFRIDLGRVFLVNGIATQGDGTYGPNFFPDYKLGFALESPGTTVVDVKEETSSAVKIFPGNTNNQGVKFNLLSSNPISARYVQFLKHTQPANDYTLRVEIYGRPQACWKSFGMVDGEHPSFVPSVTVSSGTVSSSSLPKLNSANTWCAGAHNTNQYIQFDLGSLKTVSGIAIQGNSGISNWVKSFKIKYGETSASNTFMDGSSEKVFVGSNTNELIVYNWFSSDIKARYVQILPQTWQTYICLRANLYGCPESGCFERIGIESTTQVANSLITSSTFASGKEAYKGRLNMVYDTWAACQVGSCSPKESTSAKPWIQLCLGSAHTFSAIIIQGYGNADDVALVNEFSVKYGYTSTFYDYHYGGALKKFAGATGRYASEQINLPVKVAAKCLRLQVEAKTPSTKDAGLRWELLGCNSVSKVVVELSQVSAVVSRGNQISLTCSVKNQLGLSLSWSSSGTMVTNSDIYSAENETRTSSDVDGTTSRVLIITANASTVASTYTCTLSDATQGHVSCTQTLSCAASYSEMSDLSNSKSITVTVTGLKGKPTTASGIASNDVTSTSVKITWLSASADFPITQYSVSIKKKSDGSIARPTATTSSLLTSFNTLTPYTDYIIEITAKTKYNVLSDKGTHEFKTDEGAAQSPLETKASADTSTAITVTWKQPSVLNGILHSYLVRYKLTSSSTYSTTFNVGTNMSKTVNQLKPFTYYDFQVAATTKGGTIIGNWSSLFKEKTPEGPATSPLNVIAVVNSSTTIKVSWQQPAILNGILHGYLVRYKLSSQVNFLSPIDIGKNISMKFGQLQAFTSYDFQVAATTKGGTIIGTWSTIITVKTLMGAASSPLQVSAIAESSTAIKMSWQQPAVLNGILHGYLVRYKLSSQVNFLSPIDVGENISKTLGQLQAFTNYHLQVTATTKGGNIIGNWSTIITVKTLMGSASSPLQVSAIAESSTTITITWKQPAVLNGILHGYLVRYKLSSQINFLSPIDVGKNISKTLGQLQAFTSYDLQVTATTKGGTIIGNWSTIITVKTLMGSASSPLEVRAVAESSTTITITWKQPAVLNGILHGYVVRYKLSSNATFLPSNDAKKNLSRTVNQLQPFTYYDFQVAATTGGGAIAGNWSLIIKERTLEDLPLEPRNLTASRIESSSIVFSWEKPIRENGILRNYTMLLEGRKTYNVTFSHKKDLFVSGDATSYPVKDLVPGSIYNVQIAALTGAGQGPYSTKIEVTTLPAAPPPVDIMKQRLPNGNVDIHFRSVSDINGHIAKYQIYVADGFDTTCRSEIVRESIAPSRFPMKLTFIPGKDTIPGDVNFRLKTIGNFTLCCKAFVSNGITMIGGKAGAVFIERKTLKTLDASVVNVTDTQFVIPLVVGPTATTFYQIIVIEHPKTTNFSPKHPDTYKPNMLGPYNNAVGVPYITAEFKTFTLTFTIGDGRVYSKSRRKKRNTGGNTYTNSPLKPDTSYSVFQRAYIDLDIFYSSNWIGPKITKRNVAPTTVIKSTTNTKTAAKETSIDTRIITGFIILIIFVIVLVVAVVILHRRNRIAAESRESERRENNLQSMQYELPINAPQSENQNTPFEGNEYESIVLNNRAPASEDNHNYAYVDERQSSAASFNQMVPATTIGHDLHYPSLSVHGFAKQSKNMQRDNHLAIKQEYKSLRKGKLFPWVVAMRPENKPKNRYANIAAYDHSRVQLKQSSISPSSDYINANFINSYTRPAAYIASQGPREKAEADYWRMVWDHNVPAIVMMTNLIEKGKTCSVKYWPSKGTISHGEISITLTSMENYVSYIIRCFSITREGSPEPRKVCHFQFISWPDHGVPEFPADLLDFRRRVRKYFPCDTDRPILVHCSAGVGRTGTFIVIDAMLDLIAKRKRVDIFNYVNFIRNQRIQLVQSEEQYILIHRALLEAITCGITEIETQHLRPRINQLQTENKHCKTGFQSQFQRLNTLTNDLPSEETSAGLNPTNIHKNRRINILPRDSCRVFIQQAIYDENSDSDYINATFVDGYKQKDAFIATEHPLPETIKDFWTMAYQRSAAMIITLNSLEESSEKYPTFWPPVNGKVRHGDINVSAVSEKEEGIGIYRSIKLTRFDSADDGQVVDMYHFKDWPDHSIPKDCKRLLSLLDLVEKSRQKHGNKPIIVVCSDGAGRTGTFLAISIMLKKFRTEQLIDVFQSIKKIRFFRPQFVENVIQYQFCHSVAQAYMESVDSYANYAGYLV